MFFRIDLKNLSESNSFWRESLEGTGSRERMAVNQTCKIRSVTTIASRAPSHWGTLGSSVSHTSEIFQHRFKASLYLFHHSPQLFEGRFWSTHSSAGPVCPMLVMRMLLWPKSSLTGRLLGLHSHLPSVRRCDC